MRIRQIKLTDVERKELEHVYKHGKKASYRKRCHIILLKSDGRIAKDIAQTPIFFNSPKIKSKL